ncbi:MAG: VCBS repeat-containing protein [Phycisphaerales bacterium]
MTVAATCLLACLSLGMGADATCPTDDLLRRPYFLPVNNLSSAQLHPLISFDFDGDGFEDLLTVNQDTNPAKIDLFISKGRGSFSARTRYEPTGTPTDLILADLDGDGILDMAYLDGAADTFAVRLGQGGTSFGPEIRVSLPASSVRLIAGDPDNDGDTDLAFAGGASSDGVRLLMNDGTGVFSLGPVLEGATRWDAVGLGDLNGDGIDDAVLANSTTVLTLVSDGAGGFLPPTVHAVNGPVGRLTLDDLDLDGSLDVIARANDAHVLFGNGDGTLAPQLVLDTFNSRFGLVNRDVNSDSFPELISLGVSGTLYIYTNNGDRTFSDDRITLDGGGGGSNLCAGDFDHDGLVDLGRANASSKDFEIGRGLSVSPGDGQGGFSQPTSEDFPGRISDVHAADIDGDGLTDLMICDYDAGEVIIRRSAGAGVFHPDVRITTLELPYEIDTGDFDTNGLLDFVVQSDPLLFAGEASVHLQQAGGGFVSTALAAPVLSTRVRVVDADGDAHPDLAFDRSIGIGAQASLYRGNGDGTFTPSHTFSIEMNAIAGLVFGDIDSDLIPDAVVSTTNPFVIYTFTGLGNGTFSDAAVPVGAVRGLQIKLAHLNGDSNIDIVTGSGVALGQGDGTFLQSTVIDAFITSVPEILDVDSDGTLDIINLGTPGGIGEVNLYLGNGDGTFMDAVELTEFIVTGLLQVAIGDFSGDGANDIYYMHSPSVVILNTLYELRSVCPAVLPCPGDCDNSRTVDFNDLVAMLFEFGNPDPSDACDADATGAVDFNDLVTALFLFGACP